MVDANSMMVITPGRIAYLGRLGIHADRIFGADSIYVATNRPFTIRKNGVVGESRFAIVKDHEMHYVSSNGEAIAQLVLEPETLQDQWHVNWIARVGEKAFAERILAGFSKVTSATVECAEFDEIFFGGALPARRLDGRISAVVERIRSNPAGRHSAEQYARNSGLSVSRFSHLFRGETGTTLRGFSAWKRARAVLALVSNEEKLVETALEAGYADSTHFCHSIRQFYGLRPRDIAEIMASMKLTLQANTQSQNDFQSDRRPSTRSRGLTTAYGATA